jgi:acetyl esterase
MPPCYDARVKALLVRLRRRAGALVVDNGFRLLSAAGKLHPQARPAAHGVEVARDLAYRPTGRRAHRLDVYRPAGGAGPYPAVLYVHGGGFRILSKDSHWMLALAYARAGYVVFNISYRLAPREPFPAAVDDVCAAYEWVVRHARGFGADPARLVLAGESAGANLVTALALCACWERPEPFARRVWDTGVVPRAVVAACGLYQVSDCERFARRRPLTPWLHDRLVEVEEAYLHGVRPRRPEELDLADVVVALERGVRPDRPAPAFFLPVGTADPLLPDTRRLGEALRALGVAAEVRYYGDELHAFHALVWRRQARRCWSHTFRFLERRLGGGAGTAADLPVAGAGTGARHAQPSAQRRGQGAHA